MNGHQTGSGQIWVHTSEQLEVSLPVGCHVELLRTGEVNRAVAGNVRSLAHKVSRCDDRRLVGIGETHRALVVQLGVFHLDKEVGCRPLQRPLPRIAKRSLHRDRAAHGRVSGELLAEISAPQGVEIKMIGLRGNVRGIIPVHSDAAGDSELALGKIGLSGDAEFAAFRGRFEVQVAGKLVVERQVADVHSGVDLGGVERAGTLQGEVSAALHGQLVQMNLAHLRQVEIFSFEVKAEAARRRRVGGGAGNLGVTVGEVNIVERGLAAEDAQIGVEFLDRFSVGRGIGCVNVALHLGMQPRSQYL